MIALEATGDIRKVALWLGHANVQTTEMYVRADPVARLDALNAVIPPTLRKGRFKAPDELIAAVTTGSRSLRYAEGLQTPRPAARPSHLPAPHNNRLC